MKTKYTIDDPNKIQHVLNTYNTNVTYAAECIKNMVLPEPKKTSIVLQHVQKKNLDYQVRFYIKGSPSISFNGLIYSPVFELYSKTRAIGKYVKPLKYEDLEKVKLKFTTDILPSGIVPEVTTEEAFLNNAKTFLTL